jgi:hypothetical protein
VKLAVGDRVEIRPFAKNVHAVWGDHNERLARRLDGCRAWVVKEPWFLAMHDVYHVGLSVDGQSHAEIEIDWCVKLSAVDLLAELTDPPPEPAPWPVRAPEPLSLWQRILRWWRGSRAG